MPPLRAFKYTGQKLCERMMQFFVCTGEKLQSLPLDLEESPRYSTVDPYFYLNRESVIFPVYRDILPHTTDLRELSTSFRDTTIIIDTVVLLPAYKLESLTIV
ncbi:hypothetical protein MVEN_00803300 [Mycena venus]|uniref:Uncharacterized protein n=1 Tax=Mycena venus TaxID=2733690 RepID=A0A8H7D3F2_9AGAR|nr:hypothetical protein MVEN_00803300 [Mycena venus]